MEIVAIALMGIVLLVASAMVNGTRHDPIRLHDDDGCEMCEINNAK